MDKFLGALLLVGAATTAHASDYGCKVLLCLSNPVSNGGPKGVAECAEPINQLYHDLRKGRAFPTCDQADGNDGTSYARRVYDPYDPCPTPLQPAALTAGTVVVQGQLQAANSNGRAFAITGTRPATLQFGDANAIGPRPCVGKALGSYQEGSYDDSRTVVVYDRVVWQPPQSPAAIDVYINNKWFQRVRQ
ncbi:putative secreted protein [Cupriavidus basilensis OR16]|uniref:Putative secreted protein n=1 Tax=Cupriavidus basilensis OR16 TaxID=1127483 RepID=H1RZV6_9BURK|nr:hypothetical protein [Cupriavidus basilensis]EHP44172.1 putative secreted protein [Cupriavidus basilensis OR16]